MASIYLHPEKEHTWCYTFVSILQDTSQKWFSNLPPQSVNSFIELDKLFITNYANNKPI